MRNRLVSTVGTSLFGNLNEHKPFHGVTPEVHAQLKAHKDAGNWTLLARELAKLDPSARVCGAEINSIDEAVRRNKVTLEYVDFLVSDTEDGRNMGKVLEAYLIERSPRDLQNVNVHVIEGLQDDNPKHFKTYGLRNLVRQLGNFVASYTAEQLVIDATGGYKAQIAVAVVFGQALGIPVLYRHERFSEIINFPPMPVTLDYALLGENADVLARFESGEDLTQDEFDMVDERIRVFLDEVDVDGETLYGFGAIGQIFLTGFRLRFPRSRELQPVADDERKSPRFRDDHYPIGFENFVEKVCADVPWIKTAHSLPYDRQKAIKVTGFKVREGKLIGEYVDKDGFGGRFEILTNAEGDDQLIWAADQLNQEYGPQAK